MEHQEGVPAVPGVTARATLVIAVRKNQRERPSGSIALIQSSLSSCHDGVLDLHGPSKEEVCVPRGQTHR